MPDICQIVESTGKPCKLCPWRLENQGKPHPHGFYRATNLRRLWTGLKQGERMSCHPRDPRMAEFEGYEGTAASERTPECAGSLILLQRELAKFSHIARCVDEETKAGVQVRQGEALRRYRRTSKAPLTREGLAEHVMAMAFGTNPFTGVQAPVVDLFEPAIGYTPVGEWNPDDWPLGLNKEAA